MKTFTYMLYSTLETVQGFTTITYKSISAVE